MARVALFIDGANMFHAQKELGWYFDYRKILQYFARDQELYQAFFYTADAGADDERQEKFLRFLTFSGYTVRRKPLKEIFDEEAGRYIRKANLDIEMVIDIFNTMHHYDVAILMTGDGDFERVIELLRARGKRVHVAAARSMLALELLNAADPPRYLLDDLRAELEREDRSFALDHPEQVARTDASRFQPGQAQGRVSVPAPFGGAKGSS